MKRIRLSSKDKTGIFWIVALVIYWGLAILVVVLSLVGCSLAPPATPGPASGDDKLADILRRGTIIVATDGAYPPQSETIQGIARLENTKCPSNLRTANQLRGFDVDVAIEIARRLGVEACFVTPTWPQVVGGSWDDRWDISVGSMVITPERMEKLYFLQPYTTGAAVLFIHKDNQDFKVPSDLSGKRIGTCTGCAYEDYLKGTLEIPGEEIKFVIQDAQTIGYETDTSALGDLAQGDGVKLDAVLTDPDTGEAAIQSGLPIRQLGPALYTDYVAAAIDKKSMLDPLSLIASINEIMRQMHGDGTLLKLSQQYYGGDYTTAASEFDIYTLDQYPAKDQ
jgi:polar amino acid transport system substrate-binding protein